MCTFGVLGLSCETPAAFKNTGGPIRPAREPKRAHWRVPAFKNTTKIPREDPRERERKKRKWRRKGGPAEGRSGESAVRRREAAQPKHTQQHTHTHQHTHRHTQSPTRTLQHTNTHTPMSSIFVPSSVFLFCLACLFFFCPVCRFLFCPECLFFLCHLRFVCPDNCLLIFPVCVFFVPWRFFFCPATARGGALDWLFDRINLDPKIQINHVESNNQLADILTEGNFTRDEGIICCICLTS